MDIATERSELDVQRRVCSTEILSIGFNCNGYQLLVVSAAQHAGQQRKERKRTDASKKQNLH